MSIYKIFKSERGFTIQELMVVLIVGLLLISFTFSLFLFSNKMMFSWQRKSDVRQTVGRVLQTIASDIMKSKQIKEVTETSIILIGKNENQIRYSFDGKYIYRNSDVVHSDDNIQVSVKISEDIKLKEEKNVSLIHLQISGQLKSIIFQSETDVMPLISSKEIFDRTGEKVN
jgi:hypothetical protein